MTIFELANALGIGAPALRDFLRRRGDLRCVDDEAEFSADEARALSDIYRLENPDAANAGLVGLTVDRFKAFGSPQYVPLAPITLVFGHNSVGKSSFLHALLWAHHVAMTGEFDVQTPTIAGNSVHLGGFENVLYRHDRKRPFALTFEVQSPQLSAFLPQRVRFCAQITFRDFSEKLSRCAPAPETYALSVDGAEILRARHEGDSFAIEDIRLEHPIFETVFRRILVTGGVHDAISAADVRRMRAAARRVCARLRLEGRRLLPRRVVWAQGAPEFATPKGGGRDRWTRIVSASLPQFLHALVSGCADRVGDYLHSLSYLGPLRAYPDRGFSLNDRSDPNWRAGGGQAWELLRESQALRDEVNRFLGKDHLQTGYRFLLRRFVDVEAAAQAAARKRGAKTEEGLRRLLGRDALDHRDELVLYDLRNRIVVSHRDVGVGLSQVIPVLVLAADDREQTLIVEQPELHIHPALQADLADVFIRSALVRGNRFILETHSEHLMLRLLKRVRQSAAGDPAYPKGLPKLLPEAISVLYAKADEDGTRLVPIPLDTQGDFAARWPDGFFTERGRELFD